MTNQPIYRECNLKRNIQSMETNWTCFKNQKQCTMQNLSTIPKTCFKIFIIVYHTQIELKNTFKKLYLIVNFKLNIQSLQLNGFSSPINLTNQNLKFILHMPQIKSLILNFALFKSTLIILQKLAYWVHKSN